MLYRDDVEIPGAPPRVSIVLPTYNRASFLPDAFASIRAQEWGDWELILVDDGSTDDTREVVTRLVGDLDQAVRSVRQENRGAYAARNRGVAMARGDFVAFFDSDDRWLPHHLRACVEALNSAPEVDWVYGAARRIDHDTGRVLTPHSFYEDGRSRPFLALETRRVGSLRIIDDPNALTCAIRHGLYSGLQTSLIRRSLLVSSPLRTAPRNESEDQVYVVRSLARGIRFGYLDDIHLDYQVHGENSSATSERLPRERRARVYRELIEGYETLYREAHLPWRPRMALRRRIGEECFWCLGYAILWQGGLREEAFSALDRGVSWWPWSPRLWMTRISLGLQDRFDLATVDRPPPGMPRKVHR